MDITLPGDLSGSIGKVNSSYRAVKVVGAVLPITVSCLKIPTFIRFSTRRGTQSES